MPKRGIEPEEAIGPVVDGLEDFPPLHGQDPEPLPEWEAPFEAELQPAAEDPPRMLVCGDGEAARAAAELAKSCGFLLEVAFNGDEAGARLAWPEADEVIPSPGWADLVELCGIGRDSYVCVFLEDPGEREDVVDHCLASDARYSGAWGGMEARRELFEGLRRQGAPDAELAAVACPMGLNIGAATPAQHAVGIVAELLAAKAGTLKRLHGDWRKRR